jgi:hypothetical protein
MKIRAFIWFALCTQVVFLVYWLFSCPDVHSELKIAHDELQKGDADLPTLVYRHSDSTETTATYDPTKSASDNLIARAKVRLSIAEDSYRYFVAVSLVFMLLNLLLLIVILSMCKRRPNKSPEPTAVGACRSAVAVHATSRRWLSFLR